MNEKELYPVPKKPDSHIVSLDQEVDDLLYIRSPFEFRAKLDTLLVEPTNLLKVALTKIAKEESAHRRDTLMSIISNCVGVLTKDGSATGEVMALLKKSFNCAVDIARHDEGLGAQMTAGNTLFSFNLNDEYFNQIMVELAADIFDELTTPEENKIITGRYILRDYAIDNDLLEKLMNRLEENKFYDQDLMRRMAEMPDKEGSLRIRLIYKARRILASLNQE